MTTSCGAAAACGHRLRRILLRLARSAFPPLLSSLHLLPQIRKRVRHHEFHPIRKSVQVHVALRALDRMLRNIETSHLLGPIFASMQSEAARVREAFQHGSSVPPWKGYFHAVRVDRDGAYACLCLHIGQRNPAARSPSGHQRRYRCPVLALVEEIARLLPFDNIDFKLQSVLGNEHMARAFPYRAPVLCSRPSFSRIGTSLRS